jgi:hypothetical protein
MAVPRVVIRVRLDRWDYGRCRDRLTGEAAFAAWFLFGLSAVVGLVLAAMPRWLWWR